MWNMGSVASATWEQFFITLPFIVICSVLLMIYAKPMNILLHGDEISQSLGVDSHKVRRNIIVLTSLLAAAAVSVSGIIGFVGLMIPHLLRMIVGTGQPKAHAFVFFCGRRVFADCGYHCKDDRAFYRDTGGHYYGDIRRTFLYLPAAPGRKAGI